MAVRDSVCTVTQPHSQHKMGASLGRCLPLQHESSDRVSHCHCQCHCHCHCVAITMLRKRLCPRNCVRLHDDAVTESDTVTHRVGRHNDGGGVCVCAMCICCVTVRVTRRLSHSHTATHTVSQYSRTLCRSRHDWGLSVS